MFGVLICSNIPQLQNSISVIFIKSIGTRNKQLLTTIPLNLLLFPHSLPFKTALKYPWLAPYTLNFCRKYIYFCSANKKTLVFCSPEFSIRKYLTKFSLACILNREWLPPQPSGTRDDIYAIIYIYQYRNKCVCVYEYPLSYLVQFGYNVILLSRFLRIVNHHKSPHPRSFNNHPCFVFRYLNLLFELSEKEIMIFFVIKGLAHPLSRAIQ